MNDRTPVQISAGPGAVWVICKDGSIWYTNSGKANPYWVQAPSIPQGDKK